MRDVGVLDFHGLLSFEASKENEGEKENSKRDGHLLY